MKPLSQNIKIVMIVLFFQLCLASAEAVNQVTSHYSGGETWPWFFTMIINLPASMLVILIAHLLPSGTPFWFDLTFYFFMFVLVGTLWWFLIVKVLVYVFSKKMITGDSD